jgi:hypothetical protein
MTEPVNTTRQRLSELLSSAANDGGAATVRDDPTIRAAVRAYVDALRTAEMTPEGILIDMKRMLAQCGVPDRFTQGGMQDTPGRRADLREALLSVVIEEYYRGR